MKCELQVVQSTREYFQCCNRVIWYQAFIYLVVIGAILSRLREPLFCLTFRATLAYESSGKCWFWECVSLQEALVILSKSSEPVCLYASRRYDTC